MSDDEEKFQGQHPASEPSADEVCAPSSVAASTRHKRSTRDMILERRSRFIAAALASAGLASAACGGRAVESAGNSDGAGTGTGTAGSGATTGTAGMRSIAGAPQVCLSQVDPVIDYETTRGGAGGTTSVPPVVAGAQVCLDMVVGGAPQVCLSAGSAPVPPTQAPDAGVTPVPEEPDGGDQR